MNAISVFGCSTGLFIPLTFKLENLIQDPVSEFSELVLVISAVTLIGTERKEKPSPGREIVG